MKGRMLLLDLHLTICASGYGVRSCSGLPVVCGRPPGHKGKHRDIEQTLEWAGP